MVNLKKRKFTDEQIEKLKLYYPVGDWDKLFETFSNNKKANIKSLARRYGLRQNKKETISGKDITGEKFNKLTAISYDHKEKNVVFWKCKCDCGNETIVPIYALVKGEIKSCGCLLHSSAKNAKDYTGQRFGKLVAIERLPHYRENLTFYRCKCDCGNETIVNSGNLHSLHIVSCGKCNVKRIEYWNLKHPLDDDKRTYSVYKHTSPNGKSYIGITKQDIERRFQKGYGYRTQKVFYRAINKYGWGNFTHEILEQNLTEKKASEREKYYIKKLNTFVPNGYNVAEGGTNGTINKAKPVIQYYKGKEVNFFESVSDAVENLGIASFTIRSHVGEEKSICGYSFEMLKPMYSYDIPLEWYEIRNEEYLNISGIVKKELSKVTTERNLSGTKAINKYTLDGKYICTYKRLSEIRKDLNRDKIEGIKAAANPNRQGDVAYGYMWRYDSGDHSDISPITYKHKRSVIQIDPVTNKIIKEYSSIASAAREMKCGINSISNVCKGKKELCKGYKWAIKR